MRDAAPAPPFYDVPMHPLDAVSWPVQTPRLSIRRMTPDDAEVTWRWRRLPEVGEWLTRAPTDVATYRAQVTDPARLARTLLIELDGEPIGDLMVKVEDAWAQDEITAGARGTQAELGWTLDPAYHGHGYATEAVRATIGLCFTDLGLRRVHAGCFAANEPSWRVMERAGMHREESSRKSGLHRSGRWMDGMDYAVLAEEWAAPPPSAFPARRVGDGVVLRVVQHGDGGRLAAAYHRNREHLEPWEPSRDPEFFAPRTQERQVTTLLGEYAAGRAVPLVLTDTAGGVVGRLTVSDIVHGAFQNAHLGYWLDEGHVGRGLMTAAVNIAAAHCRDDLGLHRLQAATLPGNTASQAVLGRTGFAQIGRAPQYLRIAGRWQDHLLFQRILT